MGSLAALQQQTVLRSLSIDRQQYGEVTEDVSFAEPVLITGITVLREDSSASDPRQVVFKAWARDLNAPAAARFSVLIGPSQAPCQAAPVAQLFPTQHVVLRGRCMKATVQLVGYALSSAPEQIKAAAEARLCPLPDLNLQLALPSAQQRQQQQQQDQLSSHAAAPSMPRPAGQIMPLRKMPPAFVLILAPLADFWGTGRTLPLGPRDAAANRADLQACETMATAVLAAKRGNPSALMAKLSTAVNPHNYAVDWDGIRDSVLDMATYCCSAIASKRVNLPDSVELAMAGVCAAILVAACQDTAVQLLTWPGRPRPAAIAITELVSVLHPPQRLQDYGTGLVDILIDSCPTLACTTLQGTFNPCTTPEPAAGKPAAGAPQRGTAAGSGKPWGKGAVGAAASGAGDSQVDESPAKKQRLDTDGGTDRGTDRGDRTSAGVDRRASVGSGGAAAHGAGGDLHGRVVPRRQSGGAVSSVAGSEAGAGDDVAAFIGSQMTDSAAAGSADAGHGGCQHNGHAGHEDDGGLYEGLPGEGAHSRSVSADRSAVRPGEGEHKHTGHSEQLEGSEEAAGSGEGEYGEGEQLDYGHYDEDVEQLDFEDTEYTGMHGDDVYGAVEQSYEGDGGSGSEGREGQHSQHDSDRGSAGQQRDSQQDEEHEREQQEGSRQEGTQQQDEQQAEEQQQQQEQEEDEREDGEYQTDEGDYAEYEPQEDGEKAKEAASPKIVKQPPVPQLYYGQMYNAVLKLALSPLHPDAANSCSNVLRRLRAYQCLDVLQSTVGPMLAGKVNALLLSPLDFCAHVERVAAAASDLATLVLQPPSSRQSQAPALKAPQASNGGPLQPQPQRQDADACVLQLMLGFRVLDLLAAFVIYIGVHVCRLVQLQEQLLADLPTAEEQQQHMEASEQQSQLCVRHAQLLDSIRALTSALTASSGGWCFLAAAREGLAALAAAVGPTRQVSLDGGPFSPNTTTPYDPQHGWEAERDALTAAAAGFGASANTAARGAIVLHGSDASAAAAGNLSDSLQRLWLLVEAVSELQGSRDVLSGAYSGFSIDGHGGIDKLNAALVTMFKGGFASEVGQQSLVAALSSSITAVRQLVVLLEHCGKVQAAAAGQQGKQQQQSPGLLGDGMDMDDLSLLGQDRPILVYGALYAPDILLAIMSSPHVDALTSWLPLSNQLSESLKAVLAQQERCGADAAKAAFPTLAASAAEAGAAGSASPAFIPGGADSARQQREQMLWQLHGFVMTGERLVRYWQQQGDGSGSGSGAELLDWLSQQLPALVAVDDGRQLRVAEDGFDAAGAGVGGQSRNAAPDAVVRATAAAAVGSLDGVAATTGVPPPWGQDVKSEAVVEFMRNAACRSAALCALHLIDMLLRGAPQSVRTTARRAADRPSDRFATPYAHFNPNMTLNPDGTLGLQGPHGCVVAPTQQGGDAALLKDGFDSRELVCELLRAGVLDVLERALRTATVALRASDADLVWSVQGGSQQDVLAVLQARSAAAALMRAACTTTASLLVHLNDADTKPLEACSLLDAIVCAHSAVVTCQEGLQACVPHPQLTPFISRATDPALNPVQRAAADAAVGAASARVCGGRVLLLLEARQALAVCLRCWQLQGWWPDPVGALLGSYPKASAAAEEFAKANAAARKAGDPSAPPPPAPRQGPRQLLSSLLGLADLCPEEWPTRGASRVAAEQRDDAAAEGRSSLEGSPFERPSQMRLRGQLAVSLEAHWDKLEKLIGFGLSCSTRMARLALVRMLARMCGVGGGTSPQLGPAVYGALRQRLEKVIQERNGLAAKIAQIKAADAHPHLKQQQINREVDRLVVQLRGAIQVSEVLLPLCSAPSIKSVLTEHKAAGVLGKAVYALAQTLPDLKQMAADEQTAAARAAPGPMVGPGLARLGADVQVLAGLLLQLVGVLMDPDISMNPWADSFTRELHDAPALLVGRAAVSYMLAACEGLNPANMALLSELLVGPSVAGGVRCLYEYPKGRFMLRLAARHWHQLTTGMPAQGPGMTQAELQMSGEWAAVTLEATQYVAGPDLSHAASCAAIAQVMRELAGASAQEGEAVVEAERTRPAVQSIPRFVTAVKTAIAAHKPGGQDSQSIPTLLASAPVLLACDAACLDFWKASAASADHLQANPSPPTTLQHTAAAATSAGQDFWPQTQLVGLPSSRVRSRVVAEVIAVAQSEQQQQQQGQRGAAASAGPGQAAAQSALSSNTAGGLGPASDSSEIPAIMARRGHGGFGGRDGRDPRNVSMHVDDFERRQQQRKQKAASGVGHVMTPGPVMQPMQGLQPMGMGPAAVGMQPMGGLPGPGMVPTMVPPMGAVPGMMGPGPGIGQMMMGPDPGLVQMQPQQQQMLLQQQMMQQQMAMGGVPGVMQQQPHMQPMQQPLLGQQPWQQQRRGRGRGRGGA